jgi:hypothetical protein
MLAKVGEVHSAETETEVANRIWDFALATRSHADRKYY